MATQDLSTRTVIKQSFASASRTAAGNGTSQDLTDAESATVVLNTGVIGGTATPTFTFVIQDSADDTTFADVAAGFTIGSFPAIVAATDNTSYKVGYRGNKRYLRLILKTVTGTSPTLLCSGDIVTGSLRHVNA